MRLISLSMLTAAAMMAAVPAALADKQLKASNWLPPKFPNSVGMKAFIDEIEKSTNGSVKFRLFTGGALFSAKATLDGIKTASADVGHIVYTYFPAEFPTAQLVSDLSMVGTEPQAASAALTELRMLHCEPCQAEEKAQNLVYLGSYSTTPYVMHSKFEIRSAADLEGKKQRSGGPLWDRWTTFVGGVPVNTPSSEMYEALERGQIDVAIYAAGGLKTHGLGDVAKYVTLLPLGGFRAATVFAFNRDTWKGLTVDERKAALAAAPLGLVVTNVEYQKGDQEGLKVAEANNINVVQPSDALKKTLEEFIQKDLAFTVENAKAEYKIEDPQAIIDKYQELYAKYERLLEGKTDDQEAMVKVFHEEIFAKVDPATYGVD